MLKHEELEILNDIIASIHSISNNTSVRRIFLEKLRKLISFNFSDFCTGMVRSKGYPQLADPVIVSGFEKRFEDEFISQYESVYAQMDYVNWLFLSQESLVYRESDLINEELRMKSPFYLNYLKPFDLVHIAGIVLAGNSKFYGAVTLYKSAKQGDFSDKDMYILKLLLPHLAIRFCQEKDPGERYENKGAYILKHNYLLTKREIEVMELVYRGYSNVEIAEKLDLAPNTVKKHIYNMFEKINVSSRTQMVKFVLQHNLGNNWDDE